MKQLIVLLSNNLETACKFYSGLGLKLKKEKHGKGLEHYAAENESVVIELYPNKKNIKKLNSISLHFKFKTLKAVNTYIEKTKPKTIVKISDTEFVIKDPDGRSVHLKTKEEKLV